MLARRLCGCCDADAISVLNCPFFLMSCAHGDASGSQGQSKPLEGRPNKWGGFRERAPTMGIRSRGKTKVLYCVPKSKSHCCSFGLWDSPRLGERREGWSIILFKDPVAPIQMPPNTMYIPMWGSVGAMILGSKQCGFSSYRVIVHSIRRLLAHLIAVDSSSSTYHHHGAPI